MGNNQKLQYSFLHQVSTIFFLNDLGILRFFLGVDLIALPNGLFFTQQKYIIEFLKKFDMINAKPSSNLMEIGTNLILGDGSSHVDATKYRQVIGSL